MKRLRNLFIIVVGLAVVVVAVAFSTKHEEEPIAVTAVTLKSQAFVTKLPESGVVQRPLVVTVPTLVAGNIGEIDVKPGDRVSAGQLLATVQNAQLESTAASSQADYTSAVANIRTARVNEMNARVTYQAAVDTAKSNLAEARRIYEEDVSLLAERAIPRNQLDTDKAKFDQAQVQYDQALRQLKLGAVSGYGQDSVQYARAAAQKAQIVNQGNQQQLGFTRIVAPFSGVVESVAAQTNDPLSSIRPGDAVTQGQALFTLAQGDSYIVKAQVDEQDIINVRDGQQANITGQDFPGTTLVGHVVRISPVAIKSTDPSSTAKQVLTTIALDRSPAFLRDGMTVDVDILTTNVPHSLVVPGAAIGKDAKGSYVYAIRSKKAAKAYVRTGAANDTQTVLKSGLAPGAQVITAKNPLLHEGSPVVVQPSPSPPPGA
jgi:RND family efflux transporter MFP subunit